MPQPEFTVHSAVDGMVWPGIPAPNGAAMLSILFQLESSQWWSEARLLARQRDQLARLLSHAASQVPFYRERLAHGLSELPADSGWTEAWRRIPLLRREEIQAADEADALLADNLPAGHGDWREIFTSGSTGQPIRSALSVVECFGTERTLA